MPGQDKKLQEWWQTSLYTEVNFNMEDRFLDKYTQANSVDSDKTAPFFQCCCYM